MSPAPRAEPHGSSAHQTSAALGVVAAVVAAVLLNVVVARHYKRWDWTSSKLYTLSGPTKTTLHALAEPIHVYVLLASGDPLFVSIRQTLASYQIETDRIETHYLDPDKNQAEFMAFREKYNLRAGKNEDGRIVADATVVVVRGDKRWFLTPTDLVDAAEADEGKSRPKLEEGLTTAIRNVVGGEKTRACFSKGHAELPLDERGPKGLGELKHVLERNNVEIVEVDTTAPDAKAEPWKACDFALVASPRRPFDEKEAIGLADFARHGGGVLLFINPVPDETEKRTLPSGLAPVASLAGVELRGDLVFERDGNARLPEGQGEVFFAQMRPHPITQGLLGERAGGLRALAVLAQSLGRVSSSNAQPADLLASSNDAFGSVDFLAATAKGEVEKQPGDHPGPLVLATATELAKPQGPTRGARVVVVGTGSFLQGQSWLAPALYGGALFVESAIAWVSAKPQVVDIPPKPSVAAGLRITEESLQQVINYVTMYIPLAAALVGLAVYLRRRSTEGRGPTEPGAGGRGEGSST